MNHAFFCLAAEDVERRGLFNKAPGSLSCFSLRHGDRSVDGFFVRLFYGTFCHDH